MKNLTLVLLSTCLLLLISCKKENPTSITGHVLEFDTNKPIEGALIYLYGGDSDGNFSNPGAYLEKIDSTISAADGSYHFDLNAAPYPILDLIAHKELYFSEDVLQGIYRTKDNQIDIVLDPHAWLELHIKNDMPVDQYDNISVGNTFGYDDIDIIYGNSIDTIVVGLVKGNNHDVRAIWFVTKGGNTQNYNESIYCPAHDTTTFEIFY